MFLVILMRREEIKLRLTKISDIHLLNRINYFKRKLAHMPSEAVYVGDSVYAEDAVDRENTHNEVLAINIRAHIKEMEHEAKARKLMEIDM